MFSIFNHLQKKNERKNKIDNNRTVPFICCRNRKRHEKWGQTHKSTCDRLMLKTQQPYLRNCASSLVTEKVRYEKEF